MRGIFWLISICAFAQVPEELRPPADERLLFQAHGAGDQIYVCKATDGKYGWTLKAPDARLLDADGQVLGKHYAGPTWESKDGSRVEGKVSAIAASPDANSIPWLLLEATGHSGQGKMSSVVSIQRSNTKGGKAPAEGCDSSHSGTEVRTPYEADYSFYGKK